MASRLPRPNNDLQLGTHLPFLAANIHAASNVTIRNHKLSTSTSTSTTGTAHTAVATAQSQTRTHSASQLIENQNSTMPASFSSSLANNTGPFNLKRKTTHDRDIDDDTSHLPARKLPAISEDGGTKPVAPLRQKTNNPSARGVGVGPPPLTKPMRTTRATSAPPKSSAPIGPVSLGRPVPRNVASSAAGSRGIGVRAASGPQRVASGSNSTAAYPNFNGNHIQHNPNDLTDLKNQVKVIQTAQQADRAHMDAERAKLSELHASHLALTSELAATRTQELAQRRELINASDEIDALKKRHGKEVMELEGDIKKKERKIRELEEDVRLAGEDLGRERECVSELRGTVGRQANTALTLTSQIQALQAQVGQLQSSYDGTTGTVHSLSMELEVTRKKMEEMEAELREAEMVRRRLHNMVQELKGNIRVFCRVRPVLMSDLGLAAEGRKDSKEVVEKKRREALAEVEFPDKRDHREIVLNSASENAMGQERRETWNFGFDRVFEPHSTQAEVFEEISQLAQSCTDGYNVCIFAYGQTGSGKSFTMEGGPTESTAGMIPRAVEQVFRVTEELRSKGWEYTMEGQFLEIYNETINDLLGKHALDTKKHEIKHDLKTHTTRVTDATIVPLTSPTQVRSLLSLAQSRRTVASTLMNERSSRSHSVFTLRIKGANSATNESCEGSLNLVDLAGSERLSVVGHDAPGAKKERLKETQSINRSLSALGDVIAALGEKGEKGGEKHIPYRNSKLTYLLQNSLSGNSKTLMVLNLSPLAAHLNESLCSLRFATKVNNTTIGTAKKQVKST